MLLSQVPHGAPPSPVAVCPWAEEKVEDDKDKGRLLGLAGAAVPPVTTAPPSPLAQNGATRGRPGWPCPRP